MYIYIYEHSCYKTLCQRHRTSIRKVLKKHGHPVTQRTQKPNKEGEVEVTLHTTKHYWRNLKGILDKIRENLKRKYENRDPALIVEVNTSPFRGKC